MSLLELARQGVMSDKIIENLDPLSMQSFAATCDELEGCVEKVKKRSILVRMCDHLDVLLEVLQLLSPGDIVSLACASKDLARVVGSLVWGDRKEHIWRQWGVNPLGDDDWLIKPAGHRIKKAEWPRNTWVLPVAPQ